MSKISKRTEEALLRCLHRNYLAAERNPSLWPKVLEIWRDRAKAFESEIHALHCMYVSGVLLKDEPVLEEATCNQSG